MPSPEELARKNIEALFTQCGWRVQDRSSINLDASRGVAIREALLKGGDEAESSGSGCCECFNSEIGSAYWR